MTNEKLVGKPRTTRSVGTASDAVAVAKTDPEDCLAAHVYRAARAVATATVLTDGILNKLRTGADTGGPPPVSKSEGLVADAAGHAIDAELLLQRLGDLADLIGTSH